MTGNLLANLLIGTCALILTAALAGAIYQATATELGERKYPPPGRLVDVGGYRLHIHCLGPERAGGPTVVMDAGIGDGKVGILGISYDGFLPLMALVNPHPALKVSVPMTP